MYLFNWLYEGGEKTNPKKNPAQVAIGIVVRFRILENMNLGVLHVSDPENDSILNPLVVKFHVLDHPKQELEFRTCALQLWC